MADRHACRMARSIRRHPAGCALAAFLAVGALIVLVQAALPHHPLVALLGIVAAGLLTIVFAHLTLLAAAAEAGPPSRRLPRKDCAMTDSRTPSGDTRARDLPAGATSPAPHLSLPDTQGGDVGVVAIDAGQTIQIFTDSGDSAVSSLTPEQATVLGTWLIETARGRMP